MRLPGPVRAVVYAGYTRRLRAKVLAGPLPRHIGLVMDGNRRWARQAGYGDPSVGHRRGAEHVGTVLDWCADVGVAHVTVFVASTDNLVKRESGEVDFLMRVVEEVVTERLVTGSEHWKVNLAGRLDLLPDATAHALKLARDTTASRPTEAQVTIAVGYGGREEVVDALRSLLDQEARTGGSLDRLAQTVGVDDIAAHLYTAGTPDPDLIIRTSGEQRLSGFLLWQSAQSELYFCDPYWPAFRQLDFLRALRSYAARQRRFGS